MKLPRLCLALLLSLLAAAPALAAGKNIVLFVTDDQSPDAGCYGNPVIKTPNLDKLAADGVRFTQAFATTASCSASRSVILTGLHNHANGHYGHQHSYHKFSSYDNVKSLPVRLAAAGYRTARVGKYHVAPEEVYQFDQALKGNSRSPVEMANHCEPLIKETSDKPFFLYFCTSDPHRGGGKAEDLPHKPDYFGNNRAYPGVTEVKYDPDDVIVHGFLPDTPACRAELAQYYQSVSRIDQGLGRLVELLKQHKQYENTLIIYTSDHGIAMPGAKTTVYEGGLRVPFVVHKPGSERKGQVCNAMISHVDITPTILDFAGAKSKENEVHGRTWLAALEEESPKGWDQVQCSHTFHEITMYYPMRVVRTRQYKLIWNIAYPLPYPFASDLWAAPTWQDVYKQGPDAQYGPWKVKDYIQRPQFELFDIEKDPHESKNLADHPDYMSILNEMKAQLKVFQSKTKDPWVLKWKYE